KWVPNSMHIDPSDPSLKEFYETLIQNDMVLIVHTGQEAALDGSNQELGNPLKLRFPLDLGVKVIMTHAASLGKCQDFESENTEYVPCFNLFIRLMEEEKYQKKLYGDISATYFINRNLDHVIELLNRKDLHSRLLNGSDYPLIAVNILINLNKLLKAGLITETEKKALREIYLYNPFLFDFVLKRTLKHPKTKQRFLPIVFEDRKL
ncbi:MAG TPA: amidohydrolase, partial [Gammaproteobacteria bacterium]|nr:amidohydrolase [Gammaproteobacteria bacterium]